MHILLISSDPYISSLRKIPKKKVQELSDDVRKLLIIPDDEDDDDDEDDSDDEVNIIV